MSSLSAPSTDSAATMRAMRRSIFAKSSIATVGAPPAAEPDSDGAVAAAGAAGAADVWAGGGTAPGSAAFGPSISASTCLGSIRVIRCR